jgi:hypothetical protein
MNPKVTSWQEFVLLCVTTREMFQPQLPGSDRVPRLNPDVYQNVAN